MHKYRGQFFSSIVQIDLSMKNNNWNTILKAWG